MDTLAPPLRRVLVLLAFALSCVGLLVFLWIEFGGSVPLAPSGYRISAEFAQATELGVQDDVEIAGVRVGHVVAVAPDRRTGRTRAVLEIDPADAPRPADTRAVLRDKSLLGETYVELSPGTAGGPTLPDGGRIPAAQVAPTVSLDQILNTLDPRTRAAFRTWMTDGGLALSHRGEAFNAALAQLSPFAGELGPVLATLARDRAATGALLGQGAGVLAGLDAAPARLQTLITAADRVFATPGRRAADLRHAVRSFPGFLDAARGAVTRLGGFSATTQPLIDELNGSAPALSRALVALAGVTPNLRRVLADLGPTARAAGPGGRAETRFLDASRPFFTRATPFLGTLVPVIDYLDRFRRDLSGALANGAAVTGATSQSLTSTRLTHYLRVSVPVNPESLTAYATRPSSNRSDPYPVPGAADALSGGLASFGSYLCTSAAPPSLGPDITASLQAILASVYFTNNPSGPPCKSQSPLGLTQLYPNLNSLP